MLCDGLYQFMSTKRKESETGVEQPGQRKKQRLNDARTIAVQSNAVAGPSTVGNGSSIGTALIKAQF